MTERDRSGSACRVVSALACLSACVTTTLEPDVGAAALAQGPIVISTRRPPSGARGVDRFYQSLLSQMREAQAEKDLPRLRSLLGAHDRADAPAFAREQMERFKDLAAGLAFELGAPGASSLELRGAPRPIGAPLEFVYELSGPSSVRLDGEDRELPASFLVTFTITDRDSFGSVSERRSSMVSILPRTVHLDDAPLELPLRIQIDRGVAVIRRVGVRIELLPGRLGIGDRTVPHGRLLLLERQQELYPAGVAPIAKNPLVTLRTAIRLGDAKHFPHQLLAAHFMGEAQKGPAVALLMRRVRLGTLLQARVAMACLAELTGKNKFPQDRERWLEWWQSRGH